LSWTTKPRMLLPGLLLAAVSCGNDERPPLVPPSPTGTAASSAPPLAPPAAWSAAPAVAVSSSPPPVPGAATVLRIADLLAQPVAPGIYLVDAYVVAHGGHCPPCPRRVVCSPCPPTMWSLADGVDAGAPEMWLSQQPPPVSAGARYRLRVEAIVASNPKSSFRIVAVITRLANPARGMTWDDGCDTCLSHGIEWGPIGGHGPATSYAVEPCKGLIVKTVGIPRSRECTAHLACGPTLSAESLKGILIYSDLKAAFARAPAVFGRDMGGTDQPMLRIALDGKEILIGPACEGALGCVSPPAGVAELAKELTRAPVWTDDPDCGVP
jgi:hypothetical protein